MLASLPLGEIGVLAAALVAGGVITGLMAGLLGVGGGAVIVPVLYEVFGLMGVEESLRMQLCVGTSLAIIVPTSLRSYTAHKARGAIVPGILKTWAVPAMLGIVLGSVIAGLANGRVLQFAFVVIALIMATKTLGGRADWRFADHLPGKPVMWAYGFFIGLAASLVGISGGGLSSMILMLYGVPMHAAIATSAGIGMLIPIPGLIGFAIAGWPHMGDLPPLSIGYISLIGFACMAPMSMLVAPLGARIAHALPRRKLEIGFGLFMLVMATRFLIASLF